MGSLAAPLLCPPPPPTQWTELSSVSSRTHASTSTTVPAQSNSIPCWYYSLRLALSNPPIHALTCYSKPHLLKNLKWLPRTSGSSSNSLPCSQEPLPCLSLAAAFSGSGPTCSSSVGLWSLLCLHTCRSLCSGLTPAYASGLTWTSLFQESQVPLLCSHTTQFRTPYTAVQQWPFNLQIVCLENRNCVLYIKEGPRHNPVHGTEQEPNHLHTRGMLATDPAPNHHLPVAFSFPQARLMVISEFCKRVSRVPKRISLLKNPQMAPYSPQAYSKQN